MKRKIKCYLAYSTPAYQILGVVLIPCVFWLLCGTALWFKYGGLMGAGHSDHGAIYGLYFSLSAYIVLYEIFTDYWMLGGCLSDAGRGLRYFRTSRSGREVMRNIVLVDLMRRFLYCAVFTAIIFAFTGWKTAIVTGLSMYCVIVGVLNGSRHFDGLRHMGIAFLAQAGVTAVNILNVILIEMTGNREGIMLVCLILLYGVTALCVSRVTVRRIMVRIRGELPEKS